MNERWTLLNTTMPTESRMQMKPAEYAKAPHENVPAPRTPYLKASRMPVNGLICIISLILGLEMVLTG